MIKTVSLIRSNKLSQQSLQDHQIFSQALNFLEKRQEFPSESLFTIMVLISQQFIGLLKMFDL